MRSPLFRKSKLVRFAIYVAAIAAIILSVLISLYLWIYNPFALGLPKDSQLVALFQTRAAAFKRLRAMAVQDEGALPYFTAESVNQSGLSELRRGEYENLFSEIGKKFRIGVAPNQVTFGFAGGGAGLSITGGWMKGIVYLPDGNEREGSIVNSLDSLGGHISDGVYLVPIERNWYLIYMQQD